LVSAGIADPSDAAQADRISVLSSAKVSAVQTRNAVIVFTVFGLILIVTDTILHVTARINNLSATFESTVSKKSLNNKLIIFLGFFS